MPHTHTPEIDLVNHRYKGFGKMDTVAMVVVVPVVL